MAITSAILAIPLAVVIGFATHRASLCNVKAVGEPGPAVFFWLLFAAVLAGVLISSLLNKSFSLEWRVRIGWLRNLVGGTLMGVGVSLAPGGNDVLILHSIPSGSPHALPAYAALLVGTAVGLIVVRNLSGDTKRIDCTGDICRIRHGLIGDDVGGGGYLSENRTGSP